MNKFQFKNIADETVELDIFGEIGESWFNESVSFEDFYNELKQIEGKKLIINLDSPGGSVFEGFSIANSIKSRKGETVCRVYSMSASIATQIMVACDTIECFSNSLIMIHLASAYVSGNKNDLMKQIELLDKIDNLLADAYVERTGLDRTAVLDMMEKETWMNAKECLEIGLIDKIIDAEMTAKADIKMENLKDFKNVPVALKDNLEAEKQAKQEKEQAEMKAKAEQEEVERLAKEEAEKKAKEEAKRKEILDRMNKEITLRLLDLD